MPIYLDEFESFRDVPIGGLCGKTAAICRHVFCAGGCATILRDQATQSITIRSSPDGANVLIDGSSMGKTPSVIQLQPNRGYVVQIEKDGHKPRSIFLGNKVAPGWLAIDILCGVLPLFVDAATGSWYTFTQRDFNVRLEEEVARSEAAEIGQRSEYTSETVHIEREKVAICYGGRVRILYKKLNDGDATISFSGIEGLSSVENGSVGFQVNDLSIGKEDIFYIFLDSKKRLTCTVLDLSRKELTLLISPQ